MRYIDKYPNCKGCPVIKYCGTQCMSVRLCNSYDASIKSELMETLVNTDKYIHWVLDTTEHPLILESEEDQGLSTLEKPCLKEIWKDEENIYIMIEGSKEVFNLDDFREYWEQILKHLTNDLQRQIS